MRIPKVLVTAAMAVTAVGLLAGCSSNSSLGTSPIIPSSHGVRQAIVHDMTGVAPKFLETLHFGHVAPSVQPDLGGVKRLAVSDFGTGAVEILNASFALAGTVTSGISGPDGDWYDQAHRLYVANYTGPDVQEYAPSPTSPIFTYSSGLSDPINVTTDESGNVYAVDYASGGAGFVNEYAQGSNTVLHTCSPGGAPEGIAVGETGKVFVSQNINGVGDIVEYAHGLAGCNGTTLGVTLGFAGGMQLDNHNNLVACDQFVGVDIIPPPYTSVSSTITGFSDPFHVALSKYNTVMFVADPGAADVSVNKYPSGTLITTLGSSNGLSDPAGVATRPFQH